MLAAALAPAALAHASLVGWKRTTGAAVFIFDDTVRPGPGIAAVRNGLDSILAGSASASGRTLTIPLRRDLPKGGYTVRWSVVSDDGHVVTGVVTFGVGTGDAKIAPALSASVDSARWLALLGRWLALAGILTAAGAGLYRLAVSRAGERTFLAVVQIGATAALAGGGLLFLARPDSLGARFGRTTLAQLGVAALVAFAGALGPRSRRGLDLLAALAVVLVVFPPLAGHALDPGRLRPLAGLLDLVHVLAAAFWIGGLAQLALVPGREAARRFSSVALFAVVLLGAAGVGRAVLELSSLHQLWTLGYGRALLVKTGLFAILLVTGARSRRPLGNARLRTSVALELALLTAVLAATSYLTDSRPGVSVRKPPAATAIR